MCWWNINKVSFKCEIILSHIFFKSLEYKLKNYMIGKKITRLFFKCEKKLKKVAVIGGYSFYYIFMPVFEIFLKIITKDNVSL